MAVHYFPTVGIILYWIYCKESTFNRIYRYVMVSQPVKEIYYSLICNAMQLIWHRFSSNHRYKIFSFFQHTTNTHTTHPDFIGISLQFQWAQFSLNSPPTPGGNEKIDDERLARLTRALLFSWHYQLHGYYFFFFALSVKFWWCEDGRRWRALAVCCKNQHVARQRAMTCNLNKTYMPF